MTVTDVWGRIQGQDLLPRIHDGDEWFFEFPDLSGQLVCEFWAQDEAGNVGYRAAILTIARGSIKCWRWMDSGCECILHPIPRPSVDTSADRPEMVMSGNTSTLLCITVRPEMVMDPHVCPVAGVN